MNLQYFSIIKPLESEVFTGVRSQTPEEINRTIYKLMQSIHKLFRSKHCKMNQNNQQNVKKQQFDAMSNMYQVAIIPT